MLYRIICIQSIIDNYSIFAVLPAVIIEYKLFSILFQLYPIILISLKHRTESLLMLNYPFIIVYMCLNAILSSRLCCIRILIYFHQLPKEDVFPFFNKSFFFVIVIENFTTFSFKPEKFCFIFFPRLTKSTGSGNIFQQIKIIKKIYLFCFGEKSSNFSESRWHSPKWNFLVLVKSASFVRKS